MEYKQLLAVTLGKAAVNAVALAGNALVIVVILINKHLRTVPNYLLISLALSDLLLGVLVMPVSIWLQWPDSDLDIRAAFCVFFLFADIFCCTASICNLGCIALDRYYAIKSPLEYAHYRTTLRMVFMLLLMYTVCGFVSTAPVISHFSNQNATGSCRHNYSPPFIVYTALISFFIPAVVMLLLYAKIYLALRSRFNQRQQRSALARLESTTVKMSEQLPPEPIKAMETNIDELDKRTFLRPVPSSISLRTYMESSECVNDEFVQQKRLEPRSRTPIALKAERQAARTLGIIMGVFIVCWLPFFVMYLIEPQYRASAATYECLTWLGYLNSACNPVIYTVFNHDFRRAFQQFLRVNCFCANTASTNLTKHYRRRFSLSTCCGAGANSNRHGTLITASPSSK